jgi:hypothetical protein
VVSGAVGVLAIPLLLAAANQTGLSSSIVTVSLVLAVIYLVCIVGIWNWKRRAVYGMAAATIASNGYSILNGINPDRNLVQLVVQLAILYYLIHPRWEQFE